jgi:cytochrome c oxidase assembly protein subunit 15
MPTVSTAAAGSTGSSSLLNTIKLALHKASLRGAWDLPAWYEPVLKGLAVEVFLLIALGGAVRVMNAGLACPDWPLCFGDYIPDYHPQVYLEFIHRAMAGLVSLTLAMLAWTMFRSQAPKSVKWLMGLAVTVLLAQVIFGGLTVLLQLHAKVVAAHLGMGTAFFGLLLWLWFEVKSQSVAETVAAGAESVVRLKWAKYAAVTMVIGIFSQILLGGMVASHYAALVCTDFPTCHGQWFPTFQGIIGLHVIHRLGAYAVCVLAAANFWFMRKQPQLRLRKISVGIMAMVICQVLLGIANVKLMTPPLITVSHLALATAILSLTLRQLHQATRPSLA